MRIVFIEIENFRGIKKLRWAPASGVNCLIGPGDSTKTTILDAIELALTPRFNFLADDSDFYNLDFKKPIKIIVTFVDLPPEFLADDRYGLHLRGCDPKNMTLQDEPGDGLVEALSVCVTIDDSTEARWSIFNERIEASDEDPPTLRYKDAKQISTTRLGPYAERHLGWGRQSVLNRLNEDAASITRELSTAGRAARDAFRNENKGIFQKAIERMETLSKHFAVAVREKFMAELDVQSVSITTGGVTLHDGKLPLRRLGTGSSRLLVSALQHDVGTSHIALVDEIEHGLEPHRIARLLEYLRSPPSQGEKIPPQIFMTTHSPVVIRELNAEDIFAVRSQNGETAVCSAAGTAKTLDAIQRHLRGNPEAFLARRLLVGEGRTECGLLRGLNWCWTKEKHESFALRGVTSIDGGGVPNVLDLAEHLLNMGYEVFTVLDSDEPPKDELVEAVKNKGGVVTMWPDNCSTEERIMLDVPWETVVTIIRFAEESGTIIDGINNVLKDKNLTLLADLSLPASMDSKELRRALGTAAKKYKWFKTITAGGRLAEIIFPCLGKITDKPLTKTIQQVRRWVDA